MGRCKGWMSAWTWRKFREDARNKIERSSSIYIQAAGDVYRQI